MPTFAPPQSLTAKIADARSRARVFRARGDTDLADRWDARTDELLDELLTKR